MALFERGPQFMPGWRHCGILREGDIAYVVFSRAGDRPECIYFSSIQLKGDWQTWQLSPLQELLRPEFEWEGALLPLEPSHFGESDAANALRDPFLFTENGQYYLLYCVQGEKGIAIARINEFPN